MRSKMAYGLLLVGATAGALPVLAADPPETSSPEDIVVTGTRQERNLLDLAGNTSVIDTRRIEATMPERPAEILNQVPGLGIQQGSGEEEITAIRSPVLNGGAGQGSVLLLEDGVPLRAAGFGNVNGLYEVNVEQAGGIEVVRGPGSALYGSNALHGLINVIPRAPSPTLESEADVTAGSYGFWQGMATVSDTVGDNGYRFSAEDHHESGWRDDTRMDEQKFVARDIWRNGDDIITATASGQTLNQQTGAYIIGKDTYLDHDLAKTNPVPNAYRRADSVRSMLRWQHNLSDSVQLSVTPYVRYTEMDFLMHFVPSLAIQRNTHYSFGVQNALYKGFDSGHSIILGTDAEYTDGWYNEFQNKATFLQGGNLYPQGLHYNLNVASIVIAPYIHSEWQVLERTRVTAGVRLEETSDDYVNNANSGIFGLYQRPASRSDTFTTVTPKLGAVQLWRPWLASYANLARGARAPQVTDLYELQNKQTVGQVKPETLDSAEIGTRGHLNDLHFDAAAYWMAKNHYFYRAADGTNVPDGKTLHRGVELELTAPLPAGFDIGMAASYALHTYAFNRADSTAINTVIKGTSMPEAPRTIANSRLGYTILPDVRAEIEWVHMGAYFTDNANTHSYGGHELFNLRMTAKISEGLSLHAKILNIADHAYADRAAITTTGLDEYFPGAPRTLLAGVTARF